MSSMTEKELAFIAEAAQFLDHPSLVLKLTRAMGKPIELLQQQLPEKAQAYLSQAVEKSLNTALKMAIATLKSENKEFANLGHVAHRSKLAGWTHTASVAATGAIGGFFGLASLPIELPVSTTVIFRGISSVAKEWGLDIKDPAVQMQCVYVFTLGASRPGELESSNYLASRLAFSRVIRDAAAFVGRFTARELFTAVEKGSAPVFTRFMTQVAALFEVAVTEKLLASAIPVAGAIGGAAINAAFCDYYVTAARYHFGLLQLENLHGSQEVQKVFAAASKANPRAG